MRSPCGSLPRCIVAATGTAVATLPATTEMDCGLPTQNVEEPYATYEMPDKQPMVRVGLFKSVPDPDWKNPADECDALKKAMDAVGLGCTRDLASSISAARKEADSVLESRDPDRYKKLRDAHFALQKHQREENQRWADELRRQKESEIGKKGKGGRED